MKLSEESIKQLDLLVQASMIAGFKKLVIESDKIRGIDEKQSVALISTENIPDFGGKSVGINRLEQLAARLNLVKSQGTLTIEATDSSGGASISILDISAGKTKVQFRCASIEAVKGVPKKIADVLVWELTINSRIIPTLLQAVSAMSAENITLASRDGKSVAFECVDTNKDGFTSDTDGTLTWIGEDSSSTSFCHRYSAKTFISMLKEATKNSESVTVLLGEGGILSLNVQGYPFSIIPTP